MIHHFTPNYACVATFDPTATRAQVLATTGMYAADEPFARRHGGPLVGRFLDAIPAGYRTDADRAGLHLNIDVRVHELPAGAYPASPGWHCDAPQRETAFDATAGTHPVQRNLVGTISTSAGTVSGTRFLDEPLAVTSAAAPGSADLWAAADRVVRSAPRATSRVPDGQVTEFDCHTLHTATAAAVAGARVFFRVSLWIPPAGHVPGLTRTEQTYHPVRIPTG